MTIRSRVSTLPHQAGQMVMTLMYACAAFLLAVGTVTTAQAFPLKFEMTVDDLLHGVAVLQGDLFTVNWTPISATSDISRFSINATLPGGGATKNWSSSVDFARIPPSGLQEFTKYNLVSLRGRHISAPAPHATEASPGPLLQGAPWVNLTRYMDDAQSLTHRTSNPHDKVDHRDKMVATLLDLDAQFDTLLAGDHGEIRLRIEFDHPVTHSRGVSEPATLALMSLGLAIAVSRGRYARRSAQRGSADRVAPDSGVRVVTVVDQDGNRAA